MSNVRKAIFPLVMLANRLAKHPHVKASECYELCKEAQALLAKADARLFGEDAFTEKKK